MPTGGHAPVVSSAKTEKYVGNVFAVHSGSLIVTGTPAQAANAKHIACRGEARRDVRRGGGCSAGQGGEGTSDGCNMLDVGGHPWKEKQYTIIDVKVMTVWSSSLNSKAHYIHEQNGTLPGRLVQAGSSISPQCPRRFLEIHPVIWHTCSVSPCQPVTVLSLLFFPSDMSGCFLGGDI